MPTRKKKGAKCTKRKATPPPPPSPSTSSGTSSSFSSSDEDVEIIETDPPVQKQTAKKRVTKTKAVPASASAAAASAAAASTAALASVMAKTQGGGGGGEDDAPSKKKPRNRAKKGGGTAAAVAASEAAAQVAPGGDAACTQNQLDVSLLKVGDRISNVETGRILAVGEDHVDVVTDCWVRITKDVLRATFRSPDQCNRDVYCNRTQVMKVLRTQIGSHLFKVRFIKQPKKGQTVGDPREMYCVLAKDGINNDFGRSDVWEQDVSDLKTTKYQRRQVDHRTMTDLWFDGAHYIVNTR